MDAHALSQLVRLMARQAATEHHRACSESLAARTVA
jgi:hypothetical protein